MPTLLALFQIIYGRICEDMKYETRPQDHPLGFCPLMIERYRIVVLDVRPDFQKPNQNSSPSIG